MEGQFVLLQASLFLYSTMWGFQKLYFWGGGLGSPKLMCASALVKQTIYEQSYLHWFCGKWSINFVYTVRLTFTIFTMRLVLKVLCSLCCRYGYYEYEELDMWYKGSPCRRYSQINEGGWVG